MSSTPDQIANALAGAANAMDDANQKLAEAAAENQRLNEQAQQIAFDLLFVQGLYANVALDTPVGEKVETKLRYGGFGLDSYCINCKRETTFRVSSKEVPTRGMSPRLGQAQAAPPALFAVHATCQRDFTVYSYIIAALGGKATKIGQWPSLADIAFGELKSIDKSLDPIDRTELGKALGLFAHDSAIGAFAYLRRVFERMISRAYERKEAAGKPVEGFATKRMDEKVAALKGELPDVAVENSGVFSILSLGLHELTEEQCIKHFPVIKAVLFQMLEQEEHKRKAALTQKETAAALKRILDDPTS